MRLRNFWNISSISQILLKKETISATNLYVFNPEHDFALAVGSGPYTPPREVLSLRKNLTLLPALYAGDSDFILTQDDHSEEELEKLPYFDSFREKNLNLIHVSKLTDITSRIENVIPWGWDHAIRNTLLVNNVDETLLPSEDEILKIRELSHRRTTIPFRQKIAEIMDENVVNPAKEIFHEEEVDEFLNHHPLAYFKAPWSSSGRGIVVSDHITPKGLREWCHGIIRRQGSLIAEPSWNRVLDFATEWKIENEEPHFLGLSVFRTSSRGKYHENIYATQSELKEIIKHHSPGFSDKVIEVQRQALKEIIAPGYEGFLGIDMLADKEGRINHCVELNLRMTMGHVSLFK